MRYMIIGSGMQGRACAFDLVRASDTREVLLVDQSDEALSAARAWLRSDLVRTRCLDAADIPTIAAAAREHDVLVSCLPYFFNLRLAHAALEARCHFLDLGGNTDIVREELALHDRAVEAGITIQPDVGLGPGMINTMAAHGIDQMDEVDEVLIRDGGLPLEPQPPMNYMLTFSEHGLINEYVENASALRDFKRVELPGLSEVEAIDLPEPLGRCEAAHASGGLSTMAWTYEGRVRHMDNKLIRYPGHIDVINSMRAMGFFDHRPVRVGDVELVPRQLAAHLFRRHFERPGERDLVVIRVTVRGRRDGRPLEHVTEMIDHYDEASGLTAMARTTGFPASIVAQMLARGGMMRPGAHPIELGVPAVPFLEEARKRGFQIHTTVREPVLSV